MGEGVDLKTLLTVRSKCVQYKSEISRDFSRLSIDTIRAAEKQLPGLVISLKELVSIPYDNIINYIDRLVTEA